jgi:hypothetical protein
MSRVFKKYFVPHEENEHQPHILRWEAILVFLGIMLVAELYFLAQVFVIFPSTDIFSSVLPSALINFTNLDRLNNNLPALTVSPSLTEAARLKAEDMAQKKYFSHVSPEGLTPWHWLELADYRYLVAGENLAVDFIDSQDVDNAWMASPTHRANILNHQFTEIGIAAAKGKYQGKETTFVVQFFGRPALAVKENEIGPEKTDEETPLPTEEALTEESPLAEEGFSSPSASPIISVSPEASNGQESFALVMGQTTSANSPLPQVKPTAPSWLKKILATPHAVTNYLFFTILTIISLALVLKIFIKIKIQHPRLIINGLFALIVVAAFVCFNQFLSLYQANIF